MQRTFQTRIAAVLLALFTGAAMVCAGFNLVQENRYQSPTDGVSWIEASRGLEAQRVPADSPGAIPNCRRPRHDKPTTCTNMKITFSQPTVRAI